MTVLDHIVARTRADVARRRSPEAFRSLEHHIAALPPAIPFAEALRRPPDGPPRVIAELKKASPSRGLIRADFVPRALAAELAGAGASALSVLTEPHFFLGHPEDLRAAAGAVSIPVLWKDFVVDELQLLEARAAGASAVLLIAAVLSAQEYRRLYALARGLGLGVLTEVHDREELDRVLDGGVHVVGINSRDLRTFQVDLARTAALIGAVPVGCVRVAESGIRQGEDMRRLAALGADAFLVGECLMRETHPGEALARLLREAAAEDGETP
ncbi:MAG: indole-3-glycerol phosphate synthase TrpC [Lentisphaeria bacterium]|nr:indole-3-glycerol phosphate synthase TrpC [Lentisphaeria bacterium]